MGRNLHLTFLSLACMAVLITVLGGLLLPKPHIALYHSLRYYLSLPAHWSPNCTWPILVVIDGVNHGHFMWNFLRFQQARKDLPFILISPWVVSNSGSPDPHDYPYSPEVWIEVDREGAVQFDAAGVLAIVDEVQQAYHGKPKFYLTGWSAGGHLVWFFIFTHPERLSGVILAGPNYAGRGITTISSAPERVQLPIQGLQGDRDSYLMALNVQWEEATTLAVQHGYRNITRTIIPDAPHGPFPAQVFEALKRILDSQDSGPNCN